MDRRRELRRASPAAAMPWSSTARPDSGGRNLGMRPMEMLLTGAAACTAFDVVLDPEEGPPAGRRRAWSRSRRSARRTTPRSSPRIHLRLHGGRPRARPAGRSSARSSSRRRSTARPRSCSAKTATITYDIVDRRRRSHPDSACRDLTRSAGCCAGRRGLIAASAAAAAARAPDVVVDLDPLALGVLERRASAAPGRRCRRRA